MVELLPEPEAIGLVALMLLQESRRVARTSSTGDLILLEAQDRLGRMTEARVSYERALALSRQDPERRFLERRLADLPD